MGLPTRVSASLLLVLMTACRPAAPAGAPSPGPATSNPIATPGVTGSPAEARRPPKPPDAGTIVDLATAIARGGPREATSAAYRKAAALVIPAFRSAGYRVRVHRFPVPAGVSWGVPVPAGTSFNLIAEPPGFDASEAYVIVGAHLDTVPQSPGANDNAAGVAAVVELARAAAGVRLPLQTLFAAFGAEEPRGPGDDGHHFGSRALAARHAGDGALAGVISLDRIGIGARVRVCTGGLGPRALSRFMLRRAAATGIPAAPCFNRASDHWPFERAGFPAVRLLGADDPDYHTPRDLPRVLERAQLARMARLAWDVVRRLDRARLR